jgi:hypothetical protein
VIPAARVAAFVVLLGIAASSCAASPSDQPAGAGSKISRSSPSRTVTLEGIAFRVPDDWRVADPGCGELADHTVVVGFHYGSCPAMVGHPRPTTAVRLTAVYGRQFALRWRGHRTTWRQQPAWLSHARSRGLTTYQLTLPWLNAVVWAQSGDPVQAKALLQRVEQRAGTATGLDVPRSASAVFIQSLPGHDGDGLQRNAAITRRRDVHRMLEDLRALEPVSDSATACDGSWWPDTAVVTVRGRAGARTYAARFDSCGLTVAGTGSAAVTSARLMADIRRLVPDSGL